MQQLIWKILLFIYNLIIFPLTFYWQLNMGYPLIVKYSELKIKCRLTSWMNLDNICLYTISLQKKTGLSAILRAKKKKHSYVCTQTGALSKCYLSHTASVSWKWLPWSASTVMNQLWWTSICVSFSSAGKTNAINAFQRLLSKLAIQNKVIIYKYVYQLFIFRAASA